MMFNIINSHVYSQNVLNYYHKLMNGLLHRSQFKHGNNR